MLDTVSLVRATQLADARSAGCSGERGPSSGRRCSGSASAECPGRTARDHGVSAHLWTTPACAHLCGHTAAEACSASGPGCSQPSATPPVGQLGQPLVGTQGTTVPTAPVGKTRRRQPEWVTTPYTLLRLAPRRGGSGHQRGQSAHDTLAHADVSACLVLLTEDAIFRPYVTSAGRAQSDTKCGCKRPTDENGSARAPLALRPRVRAASPLGGTDPP